ncbi:UDP-N-acetylenolpyruvoylglucosamine reductase [Clostridium sp. W14A]|uniref:UDP-N-acetylenolpyruvoylglucosamine reductase n=1 Tax=Caproicibacter fermentans TaxID=2576756 RepID=A0A7G8TDL3_9FIRM|nr:UDP-N-acetylmuramate dehydrogenase [Caproicibacter fermentans]OCN00768.1 UDP-N-acetylenolpyruvoylglucosamine reductase [Clostridium sp. W14A]QNK41704.1 UDP-N-acetylmuramate dehydrogenase [Caproicibacter fermentans]
MDFLEELEKSARSLGCETYRNEPMSRHTTFRIGGPADLFLIVNDKSALREVSRKSWDLGIKLYPLGNGSNLLVSDAGIRGSVVSLGKGFQRIEPCGENELECGAGISLAGLCNFAKNHSLTGLEFAWGIPGSAGGAAFMNAGAYDHSMSEVITACSHVTQTGEAGILRGGDLQYGYRRSAYSGNGSIITSLRLKLSPGDPEQISSTMQELYDRRKSKQPLEVPSAGSIFKRPPGHYAGTLIEQCGLKGRRVGGAMVSEKHAGFIVNSGGATCGDVLRLIELIQETVYREAGVRLECEVKQIG